MGLLLGADLDRVAYLGDEHPVGAQGLLGEGAEETQFRFVEDNGVAAFYWIDEDNGVAAFYWIDEDYAYALIAPLERERLLDIARQVYRDLER